MPLTVIEKPKTLPLDLGDVKNHLNLNGVDRFDDFLSLCMQAIVGPTQEAIGQQLITATLHWSIRRWVQLVELPRYPLQSVDAVEYRAENGSWVTVDGSNYETNRDADPGFVRFNNDYQRPETFENEPYPWRFTYKAGYANNDGTSTYRQVPAEIRLWMMNIIGTQFMKREADVISMQSVDVVQLKTQMARLINGHNKRVRFG